MGYEPLLVLKISSQKIILIQNFHAALFVFFDAATEFLKVLVTFYLSRNWMELFRELQILNKNIGNN